MICIGMYFMGKNRTTSDISSVASFVLGHLDERTRKGLRHVPGPTLMGLPGRPICPAFRPAGSPSAFIGTYLNWLLVAKPLVQYTKGGGRRDHAA